MPMTKKQQTTPNLGDTLYFPDMQKSVVLKGVVLEYKVNEQGFDVVTLRTDDGKYYAPFMAYCRTTEKEMENDLPNLVAMNKEIITIQSQANRKIDEILVAMRGTPKFTHLIGKAADSE
jgi:hypothetical protein